MLPGRRLIKQSNHDIKLVSDYFPSYTYNGNKVLNILGDNFPVGKYISRFQSSYSPVQNVQKYTDFFLMKQTYEVELVAWYSKYLQPLSTMVRL